ncbi:hypothetical protein VTO42DRAFT_3069 [Malbranchea cinnamomea]
MESFNDVVPPISNGLPEGSAGSPPPPQSQPGQLPERTDLSGHPHKLKETGNGSLPNETPSGIQNNVTAKGIEQQAGPDTTPTFPQLSYNEHDSIDLSMFDGDDGGDEEPNVAWSFDRSSSPPVSGQRYREDEDLKPSEDGSISRMHKFTLYETATKFYLVGMDLLDRRFRILKIDRTSDTNDLVLSEDDTVYTKKEMNQLLDAVDDGNKSSGGLKLRCSAWGLLGFIRFTGTYYMLLITKRSQVAMIGGHYIYQIDGTELIPLISPNRAKSKTENSVEEARFVNILNNVDLTRSFYFSYAYDITRTLQCNVAAEREALGRGLLPEQRPHNHNSMFVWNHHLLKPVVPLLKNVYHWCLPIIHGHVDQSVLSVYGRLVYITIIARRSRFFAGARFLKRGANDLGYVANDVETEQIVSEMLTTSFHAPGPKLYANPQYTSYVQHRGSIPLHWTQDSNGVSPKPNIELNLIDPFYTAAALHFDNLFERYGAPIYVLNLIKSRERLPRESKLLKEYTNAVNYLNQFLPNDKKIIYKAWDMSRASKSRDQDVIGTLEDIAEDIIPRTGFFHNGDSVETGLKMQNGIARTNCIDCLDRTNAAQFVIAKRALGHQLRALGVIDTTSIEYDTDAINLFTDMWHDHGDTIAIQYGGSHLVNTMDTYRKLNQWAGHSRDMVETFKRFYNNSLFDAQRQEAYNLFLGNYVFQKSQPMLWDLTTDYYLHHSDPRKWLQRRRQNYTNWFNPEFLKERVMPPLPSAKNLPVKSISAIDDYWLEYYRPLALSTFPKIFALKIKSKKSNLRYLPIRSTEIGRYDLSPFVVRTVHEPEARELRTRRSKGVTIQEPSSDFVDDTRPRSVSLPTEVLMQSTPLQGWLQQHPYGGIMKHTTLLPLETPPIPSKVQINQLSLGQLVADSLNPAVSTSETEEYERYINHPLKVPLVITEEEDLSHLVERPHTSSSLRPPTSSSFRPPTAASPRSHVTPSYDLLEYANKCRLDDTELDAAAEENLADYIEFVNVGEEGLTVAAEDYEKKRYKRYKQWLRGKSLFKQGFEV